MFHESRPSCYRTPDPDASWPHTQMLPSLWLLHFLLCSTGVLIHQETLFSIYTSLSMLLLKNDLCGTTHQTWYNRSPTSRSRKGLIHWWEQFYWRWNQVNPGHTFHLGQDGRGPDLHPKNFNTKSKASGVNPGTSQGEEQSHYCLHRYTFSIHIFHGPCPLSPLCRRRK